MRRHPSRQLRRRGAQEGPDQPRRREDQRRGDREPDPDRIRRCRTSPACRCPTRTWARRCAPASSCKPGKSLALAELVDFLQGKEIAKFKLPERLEIVRRLPGLDFGKVSKKTLATWSRATAEHERAADAADRSSTLCASSTCTATPARGLDRLPGPLRRSAGEVLEARAGWRKHRGRGRSRNSPTPGSRPAWSRSTSRPRSQTPPVHATSTCTRCGSAIPKRIIQAWGAVEPAKGEIAIAAGEEGGEASSACSASTSIRSCSTSP